MAIVAGAPVCKQSLLAETVREWEAFAAGEGLQVCYFGAETRLQELLAPSHEYIDVVLGSQPEWSPQVFVEANETTSSLRQQLNRSSNKGVAVRRWDREEAENNPRLIGALNEWLASRGLPTLHFLVEPETLGDLRDRRIFVAEQGGKVVGFVTLCPVPARDGWLTEQFVRADAAPNGTVELLLYHAARSVASDGAQYWTMGIVPLVAQDLPGAADPLGLRLLRGWAKAHYTRFYNFRGLKEFKSKFRPDHWQPVVVMVKDRRFRLRHLRAIARAFTVGPPELAVAKGCWKALVEEGRRFRKFLGQSQRT